MTLTIPSDRLDQKRSEQSEFTWPQGAYRGTIERVRSDELPPWAGDNPRNGWADTDGERLSLQIGSVSAIDEIPVEIGNRKFFADMGGDLTVRDGPLTVEDVDVTQRDVPHWKLLNSAEFLGRLANALGAAQANGENVEAEGFVEDLRSGAYDGREIGFEIFHRTDNDGNVYEEVDDFFPV